MKNFKFSSSANGKVFRNGLYSTAILAAAIVLAVLINLLAGGHPEKIHRVRPLCRQNVHAGRQLQAADAEPGSGRDRLLSL